MLPDKRRAHFRAHDESFLAERITQSGYRITGSLAIRRQ